MTKKKPTTVNTTEHAPALTAVAHYYARAAARYRNARNSHTPKHLTRARFLEAATYFDNQLTALVLRTGPKGRTLATATEAAQIKAAAHHLADLLTEAGTTPDLCPRTASDHLARLIKATLQKREAEDTTHPHAHPADPKRPSKRSPHKGTSHSAMLRPIAPLVHVSSHKQCPQCLYRP